MEISLASKRKLGFVIGMIERDVGDKEKQEQWDTYNNMLISWVLNNVCDSIKQSIMFISSARKIWVQLKQRFSVVNGSKKYEMNKQLYELKQNGVNINEYYTNMKIIWKELENMRDLPAITNLTPEINGFIGALETDREE
ncbi:Pumilio-like protein 3 [Bienertia sinuspersici]